MKRRQWLRLPACLALGGAALLMAVPVQAQPAYKVSSGQLQEMVAARFPLRYAMGGVMELTLQTPVLKLLPQQNRLGALMDVNAGGPALPQGGNGSFDVDFALRYERKDQSIRAHQIRVNALRISGLPPQASALLDVYGPTLASQALLEVVVHKLEPKDLMLADGLGMEPGNITVTAQGITVGFVPKKAL